MKRFDTELPFVKLWRLARGSFLLGLPDLSNFCCLPGRAGGSPNGLEGDGNLRSFVLKLLREKLVLGRPNTTYESPATMFSSSWS